MTTVLLLCSAILVLVAVAIELWMGAARRERLRASLQHTEQRLAATPATPQLAARLEDGATGRVLEVLSTEPGIQFYTGNFLDGTYVGKQGHLYRMGDGIALEPQKFPDAPNQPSFATARVDPGKPYRHVMIYRLSTTR